MKELEKIRISKNPQIPRDFLWLKPDNDSYKMLVPQGSSWKEVELGGSDEGAVRYDEEQSLTEAQKAVAQNNIGISHLKITTDKYVCFYSSEIGVISVVAKIDDENCTQPVYIKFSTDSFLNASSFENISIFQVWEDDAGYLVLHGDGDTITYDISLVSGKMPSVITREEPQYELARQIVDLVPQARPVVIEGTIDATNNFNPDSSYEESPFNYAVQSFLAGKKVLLRTVVTGEEEDNVEYLSVINYMNAASNESYLLAIRYSTLDGEPQYITFSDE